MASDPNDHKHDLGWDKAQMREGENEPVKGRGVRIPRGPAAVNTN